MILDKIAERTRQRLQEEKQQVPEEQMREIALSMDTGKGRTLERAFSKETFSFICEVKRPRHRKG